VLSAFYAGFNGLRIGDDANLRIRYVLEQVARIAAGTLQGIGGGGMQENTSTHE
jgi:hypothetical protein